MSKIFATTDQNISKREMRNHQRAQKIASQGMVLLENNGVLPLNLQHKNLALYGNGARRTVKGGSGSGDVNSRYMITVEQGLENAGYEITTKEWLQRFDEEVMKAQEPYYQNIRKLIRRKGERAVLELFLNPFREPPVVEVNQNDVEKSRTDTAIYVIARNSGEAKDRSNREGDYALYDKEKQAIKKIAKSYKKCIVVLNVGGVIDTKFIRQIEGIDAVVLMGQAGSSSGDALADILTGKETPGGRLAATWAENYSDYPSASTFGNNNGNLDDEYYQESIYVGYRYFDTFNVEPAYPFGFGGSYTEFEVQVRNVEIKTDIVHVEVQITNVGTQFAGQEVVQIYYSAPEGGIEKPFQELAAYSKTKKLHPEEKQTLKIQFPIKNMASFHLDKAAYILEAGIYYIRVGTNSRNTHVVAALVLDEDAITEMVSNCLALDCKMNTISPSSSRSWSYDGELEEKVKAPRLQIYSSNLNTRKMLHRHDTSFKSNAAIEKVITADDVLAGTATLEELVDQLTIEELAMLCVGSACKSDATMLGGECTSIPGAGGETTSQLMKLRNIKHIVLADGPAGLRLQNKFYVNKQGQIVDEGKPVIPELNYVMDFPEKNIPDGAVAHYQYCTALPIATLQAQTWDVEVLRAIGDIVGEEMQELGIQLWLAPGMNIQRNPLCGRNFEYYSEDPLLSGLSAAVTKGVQNYSGLGTTIKHFACNNQEDNRKNNCVHVDERALREIYLKGFEIAVKSAQPMAMMSSYNLINGIHTANSYDLLTTIVRKEWNFQGLIMSDWGTTDKSLEKTVYGDSNAVDCIKAGNSLIMPGSFKDIEDIIAAASIGEKNSLVAELKSCAENVLSIILQSSAYEKSMPHKNV